MRRIAFLLLLCGSVATATAAIADFNGRWNIEPSKQSRGRKWWLEVKGAGTALISGSFVGEPSGQVDAIPMIKLDGDELVWIFGQNATPRVYRARVTKGVLEGSLLVGTTEPITFKGRRSPQIKDIDNGKWKKGTPVELFNGKDMTGWSCKVPGKKLEWSVADGLMKNADKAADITSDAKFWNFDLHTEFRVAKESNSGVGLRARYEVQIFGDYGEPPSLHGMGALYSRIVPSVNATKPPSEWQVFDIRLIGKQVTVVLNEKTLIDHRDVVGFTAMATDIQEDQPGPITLQGDHGPVEFRKITITPLTR